MILPMEINILILRHLNKIKRVQYPFPEYLQNTKNSLNTKLKTFLEGGGGTTYCPLYFFF